MKNSQEYTKKDPLVLAAYEVLKPEKSATEEESIPATWAEGAHEPLNLPNEKELAMAITQLNFICHSSTEIRNILINGGSYPEWFQNKLSGLHSTMQDLHSYILGKESGNLKEKTELEEAFVIDKDTKVAMKMSNGKMLYGKVLKQQKVLGKPGVEVQWSNGMKGRFPNDKFSALSMDSKADFVIEEEVQTEQVKTIKVGEDAVGTDAKLHYAVVSDRKVQAVGEKEEMLDYCKENGGRVWKTAKQVGDLVEETESNE